MNTSKKNLNSDTLASLSAIQDQINAQLLGMEDTVELLLVALLAEGHVLMQGPPGMGKTSLAKYLASSIDATFKRVQFTADLLPSDILGYSIYNQQNQEFVFNKGPIFTNILLADEINRGTPRVQSALLEAMNEHQVSVDGESYPLLAPYFVIATRNHLNSGGTFPLPDSQLDRFLLSVDIKRLSRDVHEQVLTKHLAGQQSIECDRKISLAELCELQQTVKSIHVEPRLLKYMSSIVAATHKHDAFIAGVSARASIALMRASQALAFLDNRDSVYPDDIKMLLPYVFGHRLSLKNRMKKQSSVNRYLKEIIDSISVP